MDWGFFEDHLVYQERFDEATLRLAKLDVQLQQLERYGPSNPMFAVCRILRNIESLSEQLIHLRVARIEVHDGSRLDIKMVYQDEIEALIRFLQEGGTHRDLCPVVLEGRHRAGIRKHSKPEAFVTGFHSEYHGLVRRKGSGIF